ncbi:glycosyltransferase family 2 protein [Caulobacter sp. KR2-114]|uniref:glycosyltransferase family 2 protein n=1 Tax=Caulobacter sp. KR2-114 TaxID=3400912 RepID=UPI003C0B8F03
MSAPVVSLIVQASAAARLALLLPGLAAQQPAAQVVVVVAGGDAAGVAAVLQAQAPAAALIACEAEVGFCRARNLGAAAASAPWLFFLDEGVGLQRSLAIRPQAGMFLSAPGPEDCALLVAADDFRRADGYDETFADPDAAQADLLQRLTQAGVKPAVLPIHGLARLHRAGAPPARTPDERLYQRIKADLVGLGAPPDAASRQALHAEICATLVRAAESGGVADLHVHFRHARAGASAARTSLTYSVRPAG